MHTNYKKINSFEAAVIGMIVAGFLLVGIMVFAGLTPRAQTRVASSMNMFDIHEQISATTNAIQFVFDIPNEFYNQFYIAFVQVTTLPPAAIDVPVKVASNFIHSVQNITNNLADQVAIGYAAQNQVDAEISQIVQQNSQVTYASKVLGASIDLTSDYEYSPLNFDEIKLSISKLLKQ